MLKLSFYAGFCLLVVEMGVGPYYLSCHNILTQLIAKTQNHLMFVDEHGFDYLLANSFVHTVPPFLLHRVLLNLFQLVK